MIKLFSDFNAEAVVLAAGDFPQHPFPLQLLQEARRVVCCDGAAAAFVSRMQRAPWRIVGDGDSLPQRLKDQYAEALTIVAEQETNDLTKATLFLERQGIRRIAYLGATGKREDHALGNISLLVDYAQRGLEVRMLTDYGIFIPCRGTTRCQAPVGTQVSIFAFGATQLRSEGLRYALHDLTNWWQGTLNEVTASDFTIHADGCYLIYAAYAAGGR